MFDSVIVVTDKDYLAERKSRYQAIVAFSGEHEYGGTKVTEASLNGFPSSRIADRIQGFLAARAEGCLLAQCSDQERSPRTECSVRSRSSSSTGFVRCASKPASAARCASVARPAPVSATTGIARSFGSARTRDNRS